MKEKIKVGDKVNWQGSFGLDAPQEAIVTGMELCDYPRSKYGQAVHEVTIEQVKKNLVLFTLSNGHWAYSEQIQVSA